MSESNDGTVRVWDAHAGSVVSGPFEGVVTSVTSIGFSSKCAHLSSGFSDKMDRVHAQTGRLLITPPCRAHPQEIDSVHISLDLASGSGDHAVHTLEMSGTPQCTLGSSLRRSQVGPSLDVATAWVRTITGESMFWVPSWLRLRLYGAEATKMLDLGPFVHGTEWQKCIDPNFRDAK